jgi:uncharacterized protein YbaP (TraB family)
MAQTESQMMILMRGLLPAGQTLDKVVSPATFTLVSDRVGALGIPVEPLQRFKPWALALTLLGLEWQAAGFDASLGLDKHFYDRAIADGKQVQGLETIEFQISRFDDLSMDEQDRMLALRRRRRRPSRRPRRPARHAQGQGLHRRTNVGGVVMTA